MRLVDTHAHLNDPAFADDLEEVLARARAAGVARLVVAGYDLPSSRRALAIAEKADWIWATVGVSPHEALAWEEESLAELAELAAHPKAAAIGEIGLDFYYDYPRPAQREAFRRQLALAVELGKPVVIHDREAHAETLAILEEGGAGRVGGVMHCFSGSVETALAAWAMGFHISFAGPVTFKNAVRPREVAAALPLAAILTETDAPYLTPHPHRGQRNEPMRVSLVAAALAAARGMSQEELAAAVWENAARAFRLSKD